MNTSQDYQLLFQAIVLFVALCYTGGLINSMLVFYVRAIHNMEADISKYKVLMPAIFWAWFFWLMKAQF